MSSPAFPNFDGPPRTPVLKLTRPMKYALWAFGIYIFMLCLESLSALDSLEQWQRGFYPKLDQETYWSTSPQFFRRRGLRIAYDNFLRFGWNASNQDSIPLSRIYLGLPDYSNESYLQRCHEVAVFLRKAGAKAVLVPLPNNLSVTENVRRLILALNETGVVIFGQWLQGTQFQTTHPLFRRAKLRWGAITAIRRFAEGPQSFVPYRVREAYDDSPVPDVSLLVLAVEHGRIDTVVAREGTDAVEVEGHSVPTDENGNTMINYGAQGSWAGSMSAEVTERGNLVFSPPWTGTREEHERLEKRIDSVAHALHNQKTVWIECYQMPKPELSQWYDEFQVYDGIIRMIITSQYMRRSDGWNPLLVMAMTVLVALMALRMRTVSASFAVGIFSTLMFIGSLWLCNAKNIYWPSTYPLATLVLGGGILVAVRRSHRREDDYERTIASLQVRSQAMGSELRTAHDMQMSLMPTKDPIVPGFFISGMCKPAESVGGDYYDYIWLDEEKTKLGIALADVSGKAMKAAMTAVMTSGLVVREISGASHPSEILKKINLPMYLKTEKKTFVAMVFAMIDTKTRELTLANAGQVEPLLKHAGEVTRLRTDGLRIPLGIQEKVSYTETTIPLQKGDFLLFSTDGLSEGTNEKGEMFGVERVEEFLRNFKTPTIVTYFLQSLFNEAERFSGSAQQHDDITAVGIQVE
ncbi:MAG: PP2C family protein-serine/threonine phosphatase [Bacteroidota bacterium]